MNTKHSFSIERMIVADPLFQKNPSMGWFFLYCHSQAMFKEHLTDIESLGERVLLKPGQFWKSARQLSRECAVASKSTLYRWGAKLEREGYLEMRPFGQKKWDAKHEKVGRGCLNHGTGILVITVLKYWINPVDIKNDGTGSQARQAQKNGTAPPHFVGQEEKEYKKNKKADQLTFLDGGNGEGPILDLGRPDLALVQEPNPGLKPSPFENNGPQFHTEEGHTMGSVQWNGRLYSAVQLKGNQV